MCSEGGQASGGEGAEAHSGPYDSSVCRIQPAGRWATDSINRRDSTAQHIWCSNENPSKQSVEAKVAFWAGSDATETRAFLLMTLSPTLSFPIRLLSSQHLTLDYLLNDSDGRQMTCYTRDAPDDKQIISGTPVREVGID